MLCSSKVWRVAERDATDIGPDDKIMLSPEFSSRFYPPLFDFFVFQPVKNPLPNLFPHLHLNHWYKKPAAASPSRKTSSEREDTCWVSLGFTKRRASLWFTVFTLPPRLFHLLFSTALQKFMRLAAATTSGLTFRSRKYSL